jgi:hypothetical protein
MLDKNGALTFLTRLVEHATSGARA